MSASLARLHSGSAGVDGLEAGRDLVLALDPHDGLRVPFGVALDDHLDAAGRAAVDAEAARRWEAWRTGPARALVLEGADLAELFELPLRADVFIPAARLVVGLPAAFATGLPRRLDGAGLDDATFALVAAVASANEGQVERMVGGRRGAAPAVPWGRQPLVARLASRALRATGLPARVRGGVVCLPYWHLAGVHREMLRRGGPLAPVAWGAVLPGLEAAATARAAAAGGWTGFPGARARGRARRRTDAGLAAARGAGAGAGDPIDEALHQAALAALRAEAAPAVALGAHLRDALGRGRTRGVLLPYDSPEIARTLLAAAGAAGLPSLLSQHGFENAGLGDPDKTRADHVAVWSARDGERQAARTAAPVTVTGNPGADHLAGRIARAPSAEGPALVLVEYSARLSARVDERIGSRHVDAALRALARARPGSEAIVRPHPADRRPQSFAEQGARIAGVRVRVDAETPLEELAGRCSLCVGALSTATLQAAALGTPTVFLDLSGVPRLWPFDGAADGIPRAESEDQLAQLLGTGRGGEPEVAEAAREALGVRGDAVARVVELVGAVSAGGAR